MKRLACGAVVPDCAVVLEAETEDELLQAVARHAREAHGIGTVSPSMVDQVRANIEDV